VDPTSGEPLVGDRGVVPISLAGAAVVAPSHGHDPAALQRTALLRPDLADHPLYLYAVLAWRHDVR